MRPTEAVFALSGHATAQSPANGPSFVRMTFVGAGERAATEGVAELEGKVNYLMDPDPSKRLTDVPTFARVRCREVYEGVDVVWYGNQRRLEYDLVVAPGADLAQVALEFSGADSLDVEAETGDLLVRAGDGTLRQHRPVAYREIDGTRRNVEARYALRGDRTVGFEVAHHDATAALVVDPTLVYSTYLGGTRDDDITGIVVDDLFNAYVVGTTTSTNFPLQNALPSTGHAGGAAVAFVAKINPTGTGLVWSSYVFPGNGRGIALDDSKNVYVSGRTTGGAPTTTGAFQTAFGGINDAFAAKINTAGSAPVYATYLGGSNVDEAFGIAVDAAGAAYVTGTTYSDNFPTHQAIQPVFAAAVPPNNPTGDAFVTKLDAAGNALAYSTYLGGTNNEFVEGIAIDAAGSVVVTGYAGAGFPTTAGAMRSAGEGPYVAKVNAAGTALTYSTFLPAGPGGSVTTTIPNALAVDAAGNAYIVGKVFGSGFPVVKAFQPSFAGGRADAFVTKVNVSGTALVFSTFLGGGGQGIFTDAAHAVAVDRFGYVYVGGETDSSNFPVVNGIPLSGAGGPSDAFVSQFTPDGCALVFSTLIGSSNTDRTDAVAVDDNGDVYIGGIASAGDFPTVTPIQATYMGGVGRPVQGEESDAFLAKITRPVDSTACAHLGTKPSNPVLPTTTTPSPGGGGTSPTFRFFDDSALWFDPPPTSGYDFRMVDAGALSTAILDFPTGVDSDDRFDVSVEGVPLGSFGPGEPVVFDRFATELGALLVGGQGVAKFTVSAIDPAVDSASSTAFPIQLDFNRAKATFEMQGTAGKPQPTVFGLTKVDVLNATKTGKDKVVVKGTLPKLGTAFDPRAAAGSVTFGSGPIVIPIPANDPGWKKGKKGLFTWKSAKGVVPTVVLHVNGVKGTFDFTVAKLEFGSPPALAFTGGVSAGGTNGSKAVTLVALPKGKYRFRP